MAWNGYFTYGDTEVINVARTERYMTGLGTSWFKPVYGAESLHLALGHEQYGTPLTDGAPWVDDDLPESTQFYGVYPIDVTGIEDSTRQVAVTQSTRDGAAIGSTRYASRESVFKAVLFAETELAAEYGFRWLKQALSGSPCMGDERPSELTYLVAEPVVQFDEAVEVATPAVLDAAAPGFVGAAELDGGSVSGGNFTTSVDGGGPASSPTLIIPPYPAPFPSVTPFDPTACLPPLVRRLRKVKTTGGPTSTGKRTTTDGMHVWMVQWTITAGDAHEYSLPRRVFWDYRAGLVPQVTDGVIFSPGDTSLFEEYVDPACPTPIWTPIYDPMCPTLSAPPPPPDVQQGCWTDPDSWWRWWITTPRSEVPRWDVVTPVLDVYANDIDLRGLRVRFYRDEEASPSDSIAACGWDFDMLITYLPAGFRLSIDASAQTITAMDDDGIIRSASSLVMGSDGKPFTWPTLSCDRGYVVVFDLADRGVTPIKPVVGMSLVTKVAA